MSAARLAPELRVLGFLALSLLALASAPVQGGQGGEHAGGQAGGQAGEQVAEIDRRAPADVRLLPLATGYAQVDPAPVAPALVQPSITPVPSAPGADAPVAPLVDPARAQTGQQRNRHPSVQPDPQPSAHPNTDTAPCSPSLAPPST
jgi:hypothetical protein